MIDLLRSKLLILELIIVIYGPYVGVLLSATAVDGFNYILPLAFEAENLSSCEWFMERVRSVVGRRHKICVISDRHVGIIAASYGATGMV